MNKLFNLEFLKEIGRVILLAVVSYLSTEVVVNQLLDLVGKGQLDSMSKLVLSGLILSILRAFDKQLHDSGVAEKGLTRF